MNALWALILNALLPEVQRAIAAHFAATGKMPTFEELTAALNADADAIDARMQAEIDAKAKG